MAPTRRRLLSAAGTSLVIAGCLGGDGGDGGDGVRSHPDFGDILVDADGMTLYLFESDERGSGESTCYDGCAQAWPPLAAGDEPTAGDGVSAGLTTFERDDGTMQVAADGWPLYYYASDESPGDATGQGANDVWWVVAPDGSKVGPNDGGADATETTSGDGGFGGPYD